ncbi:hypothetical protein DM586_21520 [Vibrio fluvialis]|nr:hypothetical protein DM586_21520 [Vibrio fluvialis]BEI22496.1 hypothetical protein KKIDH5335_08280 [Vibrio fluvialis]
MTNAAMAVRGKPKSHIAMKSIFKQNVFSPPALSIPLMMTILSIFKLIAMLKIVIAGWDNGRNNSESKFNPCNSHG